eukprot:3453715-Heterocapsa_arctica.AAC.1
MQEPPGKDVQLALFIRQVKDCPKLRTEWEHYYKSTDTRVRCFEYLYDSAQLVVQRERFEAARSMKPS